MASPIQESAANALISGGMLLKVNAGGKAAKKYVTLTPDLRYLKWTPSRKSGDPEFVDMDTVQGLTVGFIGPRLVKFSGAPSSAAAVHTYLDQRVEHSVDDCCGWLEKFGGAHGGRKNWHKRFFVLQGSMLYYFTQVNEPTPRGGLNISGAIIGTVPENECGLLLTWSDGQPDRELRAETPEERDKWMFFIRKALRLDRMKAGKRPQGAFGAGGGALKGAGGGSGGSNNSGAAPFEVVPPTTFPPPPLDAVCLSFDIYPQAVGSAANAAKGAAGFVCGSWLALEQWHTGFLSALALRQNWSLEELENRLRDVAASNPHDVPARAALATVLDSAGKHQEALDAAFDALDAAPCYALAAKTAGKLLLQFKNDPCAAVPQLRVAASAYGMLDLESFFLLGQAYAAVADTQTEENAQEDRHLAAGAYELVFSLDPKHPGAHTELAELSIKRSSYDEAINHLRIALKANNPNSTKAHAALAKCFEATNKPADAATEYQIVLEAAASEGSASSSSSSYKKMANEGLARVLVALGRNAEAIAPLTAVLALDPRSDSLSLALARAYFETEADRYRAAKPGSSGSSSSSSSNSSAGGSKAGAGAGDSEGGETIEDTDNNPVDDEGNDEGEDGGIDGGDEEAESGGAGGVPSSPAKPVPAPAPAPTPAPGSGGAAFLPPPPPPPSGSSTSGAGALPPPPSAGSTTSTTTTATTAAAALPSAPASTTTVFVPTPLGPLPNPVLSGVASIDEMSSQALLDAADALIVTVLSRVPASPAANILCGLVYEKLSQIEAREVEATKAGKRSRGEEVTDDDDHAESGWTVEARLDAARKSFAYVSAAYPTGEWADAPMHLGRMMKEQGKWDEAIKELSVALQRNPSLTTATDLLARVKRLQAGQPEFPVVKKAVTSPRGKKNDDVQFSDLGIDAAAIGIDANMTPEERRAAYFAHLRAEKKRKADEELQQETLKLNAMTPEERVEYEAAKDAKAKHEAKKDKVLNKQLGQYGGGGRGAAIMARGRGGGRGGGRGRGK